MWRHATAFVLEAFDASDAMLMMYDVYVQL